MKKGDKWIRLLWDGKITEEECTKHSWAWSGRMPCTGVYGCVQCGKPYEREDQDQEVGAIQKRVIHSNRDLEPLDNFLDVCSNKETMEEESWEELAVKLRQSFANLKRKT